MTEESEDDYGDANVLDFAVLGMVILIVIGVVVWSGSSLLLYILGVWNG